MRISVHYDHRVRVWVCYEHRTSQVAYRREGALARSIKARIRVLRVKVSLGATRANVSVCIMLLLIALRMCICAVLMGMVQVPNSDRSSTQTKLRVPKSRPAAQPFPRYAQNALPVVSISSM